MMTELQTKTIVETLKRHCYSYIYDETYLNEYRNWFGYGVGGSDSELTNNYANSRTRYLCYRRALIDVLATDQLVETMLKELGITILDIKKVKVVARKNALCAFCNDYINKHEDEA